MRTCQKCPDPKSRQHFQDIRFYAASGLIVNLRFKFRKGVRRVKKSIQGGLGALLLMTSAGAVFADGGVTFTNIAAGDQAGVSYRRVASPDRQADRDAIAATVIPVT